MGAKRSKSNSLRSHFGSTIRTIGDDRALIRAIPELRAHQTRMTSGRPIIGIAQTGSDLSPCNRHHLALAERVRAPVSLAPPRRRLRIPGASDPGNRQAADRCARTAIWPISAWSKSSTVIRSTASY